MTTQQEVTLSDFERALLGNNPFVRGRVSEPSRTDVDVPGIHGIEFSRIKRWIEAVRTDGAAAGVVLLGAAGVGKSHLLSRLWRWTASHRVHYVFLHNVLAAADRMPRYLTAAIVSALVESREGLMKSRLAQIVGDALSFSVEQIGRVAGPATIQQELEGLVRNVGDGKVVKVLSHFLHAAALDERERGASTAEHRGRANAAVAWLCCDSIEPQQAQWLALEATGEETEVEDDARAEQILCTLFDLCGAAQQPFVLCVDQVDNLDDDRVRALAAFFHVLLDHARSFVLVTSGVTESMVDFKRRAVIPTAAWDRVAQYEVELNPVSPVLAREILQARGQAFLRGFERAGLPVGGRPLFPLTEAFARQSYDKVFELRPRDVIRLARDEWEALQSWVEQVGVEAWLTKADDRPGAQSSKLEVTLDQAIEAAVRRRVRQAVDQRRLSPGTLPPNADNLASLTVDLLRRCEGRPGYSLREIKVPPVARRGGRPLYDLEVLEQDEQLRPVRTGCSFLATQNANSATALLRKLKEDPAPPDEQLLVTDEERCRLRLGAKGREYYQALRGGPRFRHVKLDFAAYAHLDALHTTIGDARVGDLEVEHPRGTMRTVSEAECVDALHRTGLFVEHPLLHELLTQEPQRPPDRKTDGQVSIEYAKSVLLSQVSWRLGMDVEEVCRWVLQKKNLERSHFQSVQHTLVEAADLLHKLGRIDSTPTEGGGRFIQLLVS